MLSVCLVALVMVFFAPAVNAQTAGDVTQEEIQSVARASLEVERINSEWAPQMEEATTQEEVDAIRRQANAQDAIRRQANAQMVDAIEAEGLDVNTYTRIIELAQRDPALTERIMEHRNNLQ
ncbi:MAG: DUF4168 domain-containing protein [Kiloniellales bacterium]